MRLQWTGAARGSLSLQGFTSQFARLRAHIEAGRPLPVDLGAWALRQLEDASSEQLRRLRDDYLRQAATLVGGSLRARAIEILDEDARLSRVWHAVASQEPDLNTFRGVVHAARLILPIPAERQLRSIIGGVKHR